MKTVLITGATGFLGSNLIKRLSGEGYQLIALVRNKESWYRLLNETLIRQGESHKDKEHLEDVELAQGDITHPLLGLTGRRFRRLAWQVDTVFHCAALTDFTHRANLFHTNVEGTRHILQFALLGRKKHLHHISSAYVAGKYNGVFYEEDLNKNQSFNNSYEESKFISEVLVRRFAKEHLLPFTVYRPSIIVGNSNTGHTQCYKGFYAFLRALSLIKERVLKEYGRYLEEVDYLKRGAVVKIPMRIFGDPESLVNLVPVDYVVRAISELFEHPEAKGKTFHLTNPYSLTLAQLMNKVTQSIGIEEVRTWWQDNKAVGASALNDQLDSIRRSTQFSSLEKFFHHYIRPYLPYLQSHLSFDNSNTTNLLNGKKPCPKITPSLVSLLINRAVEDRWGARRETCCKQSESEGASATMIVDSACGMTGAACD